MSQQPHRPAAAIRSAYGPLVPFLLQAAHSFVNDSLLTTVCLQYRPAQVAAAVVYLSYLYMGLPRVDMALLETDIAVVAGKAASTASQLSPFVILVLLGIVLASVGLGLRFFSF